MKEGRRQTDGEGKDKGEGGSEVIYSLL